ncbi:shufflon system plasmid conjugative transfer pilus tip adhesin PilV [Pararhizobium sp. BT-229]|uniref:shufflon system plasmid conjugative transfer pilus tip adhesin PilV n=1 Tax=Pararhizobium sp. BT-229 TaxID=2986923 RepID=UPI0021F7282D|nr:shufflon system plasmid conjugative transfer pilus tip adhesin PilV [Pararhizobium sp. BT-229]MCV9965054.1 shufflon system plasmid conjugative transfer pilus tip adhesin PilV [Pararhizobium sp. BT-229]
MKTPNTNFRKRVQSRRLRGSNLMDTVATLAVVAVLMVLFLSMQQGETDRIAAKNTADKLTTIGEAAKRYLSANYSTLLASTAGGPVAIEVGRTSITDPVPANSLQGKNFLPAGFIDVNGFQQNTALLVRRANATTLDAMLTTYGGREIPDRMLGTMAKLIGPAGGYVPSQYPLAADAGNILGIGGGWRSATAAWGAAATRPDTGTIQMTMNFEDGSLLKDYLYRNNVGDPEANRMRTDIDMYKNGIKTIGKLSGVADPTSGGGNAVIIGDAASPETLRATRDIWADRNVRATGYVRADSVRSDTYVEAQSYVKAGTDVIADRNVTAANNVTAGNNVVAQNRVQGKTVVARKAADGSGGDITADGDATVAGDLTAGRIDLDAKVFGSNVDGSNRQFRAPVTLGDLLPRSVAQYSYVVSEASPKPVPKPTCRGGYANSRIMVYRQVDSSKTRPNIPLQVTMATANGMTFVGGVDVDKTNTWIQLTQGVVAKSNSLTWQIQWVGDAKADNTPRQVIAQTFCYYGED